MAKNGYFLMITFEYDIIWGREGEGENNFGNLFRT